MDENTAPIIGPARKMSVAAVAVMALLSFVAGVAAVMDVHRAGEGFDLDQAGSVAVVMGIALGGNRKIREELTGKSIGFRCETAVGRESDVQLSGHTIHGNMAGAVG